MATVRNFWGATGLTVIEMNERHFVDRQITDVRANVTRQVSHIQITSLEVKIRKQQGPQKTK
jgi:hypothetical protein